MQKPHALDETIARLSSGSDTDPYRELFERSADAILFIEGNRFIDCNDAAIRMLRCGSKAEVLRTHPSTLSPSEQPDGRDSREKADEMIAIAFEHGSHRFEWDHKRADGEVFPVEVLLTAVREPGRRVLHVVWRDVSDRKRLESQLRHAHKMEAIGKLAGGIAHDFNNVLVAIIGNTELLEDRLEGNSEALEHLCEIRLASDRAAGLVRQLLAFGRKQELAARVLDLRSLIGDVRCLLGRVIGEDIELETALGDEPLMLKADPGQVEQVLLNLVSNARDAMPGGGTLAIATRRVELDAKTIGGTPAGHPIGPCAELSVSDTGAGMAPEVATHAFDPFFTTKELGKGTGLGLATVHGIIRQSGGVVSLQSAQGHGTTVKIHLPLTDESATGVESGVAILDSAGGDETILVAEDETAVANVVVAVLEEKGYTVLLAGDGNEALALFRRHRCVIDLIVSDVIMPGLCGPDFVLRAAADGQLPRVLFVSGYTGNALGRLHALGDKVDLLQKPFTAAALVARVRGALDRGRSSVESPRIPLTATPSNPASPQSTSPPAAPPH